MLVEKIYVWTFFVCPNLFLGVPQSISLCASKYFFVCLKILAKSSPKDLICEILQRFFFCGKYSNFLIGIRHIICIVGIPHRDILNSPFTIVIPCMCVAVCVSVWGDLKKIDQNELERSTS